MDGIWSREREGGLGVGVGDGDYWFVLLWLIKVIDLLIYLSFTLEMCDVMGR
jgi:hypothetical protein